MLNTIEVALQLSSLRGRNFEGKGSKESNSKGAGEGGTHSGVQREEKATLYSVEKAKGQKNELAVRGGGEV